MNEQAINGQMGAEVNEQRTRSEDAAAEMEASEKQEQMQEQEASVRELLDGISSGQVTGASLTAEQRQQCVAHLTDLGASCNEISQMLNVSMRTIQRDRTILRAGNALAPGRKLGDELLGELQQLVLSGVQRLVRMCNDPKTPAYARLWSEEAIVRNYKRLIDAATQLHYITKVSERAEEECVNSPEFEAQILEELRRIGSVGMQEE